MVAIELNVTLFGKKKKVFRRNWPAQKRSMTTEPVCGSLAIPYFNTQPDDGASPDPDCCVPFFNPIST
jgi:hypothetical protein